VVIYAARLFLYVNHAIPLILNTVNLSEKMKSGELNQIVMTMPYTDSIEGAQIRNPATSCKCFDMLSGV